MAIPDIRWLLPWAPSEPRTQHKPRGRHRAQPAERPMPASTDYLYPRVRPPKKHR